MIKVFIGIGLLGLLVVVPYLYFTRDQRKCLESHEETYIIPAWTQHMMVGKIMSPIFHPAREAVRTVCDRYEEEG